MILPFDEWRPDTAPLSPGPEVALNVLPAADGYVPMPMPVFRGPGGLLGTCSYLISVVAGDGLSVPVAFTTNGIYRPTGAGWTNIGRTTASYVSSLGWNAVQWGENIFAVNGRNVAQVLELGSSNFRDITGQLNGLGAKYLAVVGDFLVLANAFKAGGNEPYPMRVWWSGRGRPEEFDPPDIVIQSGFVDRPAIGRLQGITGGEFGLILGEEGLDRMDYTGPPTIWQFRTLETDIGCEIPRSIVQAGDKTFWWSRRGWRMSNGGPSQPIGLGKVDEWTRSLIDFDQAHLMTSTALLRQQVVMWAFVSRGNSTGRPDEVLAYNWDFNRWTRGRMDVDCLGRLSVPSTFTDDPGVSQLFGDFTDDSSLLTDAATGGRPFAAAVMNGSLYAMQPKRGTVCQLTTTELNLVPGRRTAISRVHPLIHGVGTGDTWLYMRSRDDQRVEAVRLKGPYEPEADGTFSVHTKARYIRVHWNGRTPFTKAMGIEIPDWAITEAGRR
jgi:hypothetical protein